MSPTTLLLSMALCLLLSAMYSGSETGFYSISRLRLEGDVQAGRRMASLVQRMVRDERGLLITILIGNNLMLELVTGFGDEWLSKTVGVGANYREVLLSVALTPIVFLFAELVPKDMFRRRPHTLLGWTAPLVGFSRLVFLPVALPLRLVSSGVERLMGVPQAALHALEGRVQILEVLDEGTKSGALAPHARQLMDNVLELRAKRLESISIPWSEVWRVELSEGPEAGQARLAESEFSRLPVVGLGGEVIGYLHVLDVLARRAGFPPPSDLLPEDLDADSMAPMPPGARWVRSVEPWAVASEESGGLLPESSLLRPLLVLDPETTLDQALALLRTEGQLAALVGTPAQPLGWVTLKDLVQEISGELGGW